MSDCISFKPVGVVMGLCAALLVGCSSGGDESLSAQGWDTGVAPQEMTWSSSVGCLVLPSSVSSGPYEQDPGAVPRGFERSPQGAVMAAVLGQGWLAAADDDQWPMVVNQFVAPGQGKDQWAQARATLSVEGCLDPAPAFVGFAFDSFTEDRAALALAVRRPDGGLYAMPTQLVWQDEDWKIVLPSQDEAVDAVELDNLEEFVMFSQEG
ncbi:hypothetical protein [Corynebacterium oculi]|uniref:DUF8175 domain-containing protein n=1 Tax=Corynebacterium oculi TaxID=1544416 RepID=A0A0Q0YNQ2_9CORY|nr:hypothetical protein [Corynebacterium oculi]KQB84077.1 hypothetical protein Cocul_00873 [Corynebacterium oculi]